MRYIFLGAPGVGKGTQAGIFSKRYKIPHIATGDLLRKAIREKTSVGLSAKSYIDAGKLVPDSVIIDLMKDRLSEPDAQPGYILDGFPRTLGQGEALARVIDQGGQKINRVIYFVMDEAMLLERIIGRRSCPSCQSVYHLGYNRPERVGFCNCGVALVQRKDDRPETVKARLEVYHCDTLPLVGYYRERGLLVEIKAGAGLEIVSDAVNAVFLECAS